jgi:hypothetical protein
MAGDGRRRHRAAGAGDAGAAGRAPPRGWHRGQRVRGCRRARPGGAARRPPLHHSPPAPGRAGPPLPEGRRGARRAVRGGRPRGHLGRHRQRHRPRAAPHRGAARAGGRGAGGPRDGRVRPAQWRRAAVQRHAPAPRAPQRGGAPGAGPDRRPLRRPPFAHRPGRRVRRQRAHAHPPLRAGDRHDPAAVPAAAAGRARRTSHRATARRWSPRLGRWASRTPACCAGSARARPRSRRDRANPR